MFHFTKEHGSFYYYERGKIGYMADEISIAYDPTLEPWVLLKHGPPECIEKWLAHARVVFPEIETVTSAAFDPEELTRAINTTGYIEQIVTKIKKGAYGPGKQ